MVSFNGTPSVRKHVSTTSTFPRHELGRLGCCGGAGHMEECSRGPFDSSFYGWILLSLFLARSKDWWRVRGEGGDRSL